MVFVMRLFEEEITDTIATDGPCDVLSVEERHVVRETHELRGTSQRSVETYGVVVYRARARMHPTHDPQKGWAMPESALETRLILVRPSHIGTDLPPATGRYLGSFRQAGERIHAFLAQKPRDAARPEERVSPGAGKGPAPAAGAGGARPQFGSSQSPAPRSSDQQSGPRRNGPPGRQS